MTNAEKIKAIDAEIKFQEAELKRLREELKAITTQEENQVDRLFDAVLNCPHSITHESVTLHFYPRQKEGHNALAQLHHRLAAYDQEARQRELQLLSEIEALERLALANLKQQEAEATPIAWYVTGCSTMLDEHDAKAEAKRCGGSAKAVPLYTSPPAQQQTVNVWQQALHEEEDEEDDDSEYDCPHCGGTGEGQYDGQTCSVCRGKGVCPK